MSGRVHTAGVVNPSQDLGEFPPLFLERKKIRVLNPGETVRQGFPLCHNLFAYIHRDMSVSMAGELLQWGQSFDACLSPESSTVPQIIMQTEERM